MELFKHIQALAEGIHNEIEVAKEMHCITCINLATPKIEGEWTSEKLKNAKIECHIIGTPDNFIQKVFQDGIQLGADLIVKQATKNGKIHIIYETKEPSKPA